jgi:hypothetical protein
LPVQHGPLSWPGEREKAKAHYTKVLELTAKADVDHQERKLAQAFLTQ